jgi:hypothetical protein
MIYGIDMTMSLDCIDTQIHIGPTMFLTGRALLDGQDSFTVLDIWMTPGLICLAASPDLKVVGSLELIQI